MAAHSVSILSEYDLMMDVVQGTASDLDHVMEIVALCVRQMQDRGSDQWDQLYPSRKGLEADIEAGTLYVLRDDTRLIGAVVLNETQPPEYAQLEWQWRDARVLVIHRLCVRPDRQSIGAGRQLMAFAESFGTANGFGAIRLDTYTGNPKAAALYERRGYRIAGYVHFRRRKLAFVCFERPL